MDSGYGNLAETRMRPLPDRRPGTRKTFFQKNHKKVTFKIRVLNVFSTFLRVCLFKTIPTRVFFVYKTARHNKFAVYYDRLKSGCRCRLPHTTRACACSVLVACLLRTYDAYPNTVHEHMPPRPFRTVRFAFFCSTEAQPFVYGFKIIQDGPTVSNCRTRPKE